MIPEARILNRSIERNTTAEITELFSSIQGEGPLVGVKQIFVRFKECNIRCAFCDTPSSLPARAYAMAELIEEIEALERLRGPHHSISFTGGEPLLYAAYLRDLLPQLRSRGFLIYLETNATMPEALLSIVKHIDIIAMDCKLPSATAQPSFWKEHKECLALAKSNGKDIFVKIVITQETESDDAMKAFEILRAFGADVPCVLQPVTPIRGRVKPVSEERLISFMEIAEKAGVRNVRIIPQVHTLLKVR